MSSFQNSQQASLFHLESGTQISVYFEMLTEKDKNVLKDYVKQTRNINVETTSFIDMPFVSMKRFLRLLNKETKKVFILDGKTKDQN